MHPLSAKTTIATIDHVCVMLKPWSSEERMTVVTNGSGYRDDQIIYWLSGLIREQKMSKPETKIGKWNEVDSLSEDLGICRGGCYNFYKTCFPLGEGKSEEKWQKNSEVNQSFSPSSPLTGLLSKSDRLFFSCILLRSAWSSPDVKKKHPSPFYTSEDLVA